MSKVDLYWVRRYVTIAMPISETFFLMLLPTFVGTLGLLMWYKYKINERYKSKYKGALTELGKMKSKLNKSMNTPRGNAKGMENNVSALSSLTLEELMEQFGFDPKELNNPIVRPIAEKIFNSLQAQNTENSPTDDSGY